MYQKWVLARAVTRMEKEEAVLRFPFEFGTTCAIQLSVVALVLVLGTMIPLLLPFGAVYFLIKHCIDKWMLDSELADLFEDCGVHPTQLEQWHAWDIDTADEVKARASGLFMKHDLPPLAEHKRSASRAGNDTEAARAAVAAAKAKADAEAERKRRAERHAQRLAAGTAAVKAREEADASRKDRATAVLRKRGGQRKRLDPAKHGPLSHYGGRIAHHSYSLVPIALLMYSVRGHAAWSPHPRLPRLFTRCACGGVAAPACHRHPWQGSSLPTARRRSSVC